MGSHWLRHLCARGVCPPNPSTVTFGTLLALAATGSAILFHLTKLGIALKPVGDHGELFALAVLYWSRFVRWRYFCCTARNCRWSAGASGQRDRITETPEFSTRTMSCWSSSNSSRYRKMPTAAGAPPLGTGESAVWKQWARMTLPPRETPVDRGGLAHGSPTGAGRRPDEGRCEATKIVRIFTVNARLGSQHTLDANSPGRMDFGPFRVGKFECTLKVFGARILFPGFQISFTVNLCALIDGVR